MGSLLAKIAEEHRDFENWCEKKGYPLPSRDYSNHQPYYDEYTLPERIRAEQQRKEHEEYNKKKREEQGDKIGVLSDHWLSSRVLKEKCSKCNHSPIRIISGMFLTDEFGCPKCGFIEGGEW